jgi:group I intron endonuclease
MFVNYYCYEDFVEVELYQIEAGLAVIYKAVNDLNYDCYIGHTAKPFYHRINGHVADLRANRHHSSIFQRAWNKYGEKNFSFVVLELCEIEERLEREQYWIDRSNSKYNIAKVAGTSLGTKRSEETRRKLVESHLGKKRNLTKEQRRQISLKLKGNKYAGVGEDNSGSKLTESAVRYCRKICIPGSRKLGYAALARRFKVEGGTMWHAINKNTWKHVK